MQLEVKHLAPYLPYKLKEFYEMSSVQKKETLQAIDTLGKCRTDEDLRWFEIKMFKPILQPLFNDNFDYSIFLMDNFPEEKWADAYNYIMNGVGFGVKIEQIPYELHDFLFQNHIDVFGLIEKGLAVNINTLSVQNDGL